MEMEQQGASIENTIADMTEAELREFASDVANLIDAAEMAINEGFGWRGNLAGAVEALSGDLGLN